MLDDTLEDACKHTVLDTRPPALYLAWLPSHSFLGLAVLPHLHLRRASRERQQSTLVPCGLHSARTAWRGSLHGHKRGWKVSKQASVARRIAQTRTAHRRRSPSARRLLRERRQSSVAWTNEIKHQSKCQKRTHHRSRTSSWRASLCEQTCRRGIHESQVNEQASLRVASAAADAGRGGSTQSRRCWTQSAGAPSQLPSLSSVLPQAHLPARTTTEARPEVQRVSTDKACIHVLAGLAPRPAARKGRPARRS